MNEISFVVSHGNFTTLVNRQLYEKNVIQKFNTYKCGINRDFGFLYENAFFIKS